MKVQRKYIIRIMVIVTAALAVLVGAFELTVYLKTGRETVELGFDRRGELTAVDTTQLPEPEPEPVVKPATPNVTTGELFYKNGILVVNKKHPVPASYAPGENPEAVANLRNLIAAGQANGLDLIYSWSGFRSYASQSAIYNSYLASDSQANVDTYSARPGYSEHQTGLAFDLKHSNGQLYRLGDGSYNQNTDWVYLHAHEFGFIVRYIAAWQSVTGYMAEPWHLRYLGVGTATAVYNSGLPLETYLGVSGGDYAN